jgi:hypothetical protein
VALEELLNYCIASSQSRAEFWVEFIRRVQIRRMVEVGVYQADFAVALLEHCDSITRYYMLDPWRHLADWNKPFNADNATFERHFEIAKAKTEFASARRVILRGTITEVIDQISNGELDFAYIDGDHTLRGIAIDLIRVYPKVRRGGFIGGDDFSPTIWYHQMNFEPTFVFPFAVYFAEAVGAKIYALPNIQFCLEKTEKAEFEFADLTGHYDERTVRSQLGLEKFLKLSFIERFPRLAQIVVQAKKVIRWR